MNYNIVSYLIGEGFKNVLKNKKSTFAAFFIMFATMITVGLGMAGASNLTSIINQLESDFPINVYIDDTASQDDIKNMEEQIKSLDYVNSVTYTSKEQALKNERENLGDTANVVLNSYTESNNPFPASFTVTLTDLEKSSEVIPILQQLENVKKDKSTGNPCVVTKQDTINGLNKAKKVIRIIFFVVGVLLIVISTVIISNTIKLTVHARRREISIMKYVGATNNFIRAPFIVEGIVIGVVAVAVSLLVSGSVYELIYNSLNSMISTKNYQLLLFKDIFYEILLVFAVLGIGIGVLGSSLSMKKYLKV